MKTGKLYLKIQASYKDSGAVSDHFSGWGYGMIEYKVVELSVVTDESLEKTLNEWTAKSWSFDSIQFVVREASKRPSMAFVMFTREKIDS